MADPIENTIARIFKKSFLFLLVFILAFQMLATFMEIQKVGITHGRYLILLFGLGSIISALWYAFKQPRLKLLPIVSFIAGLVALLPPIDAVGVSVRNQVHRVESLLEENQILTVEKEIIPQPEVSTGDQNRIKESIQYLRGINALNQLEWFPQGDSYNLDALFGFVEMEEVPFEEEEITEEPIEEPDETVDEETAEEPSIENETYEVTLMLENQYSLSLDAYDYMLSLVLENNETTSEVVIHEEGYYVFEISTVDGFFITTELDLQEVVFDFSYILDAFETKDAALPLDQMTFVEENAGLTLTVFVESLTVDGENYTIDLILFM